MRYPRGNGIGVDLPSIDETVEVGKGIVIEEGSNIAILSFGTMLGEAQKAAIELGATLVDMRFVKPLDEALISRLVETHQTLVTVEDNVIAGGAGSGVNEYVLKEQLNYRVLNIGLPDEFIKHGTQAEIHEELLLDSVGIIKKIKNFIA